MKAIAAVAKLESDSSDLAILAGHFSALVSPKRSRMTHGRNKPTRQRSLVLSFAKFHKQRRIPYCDIDANKAAQDVMVTMLMECTYKAQAGYNGAIVNWSSCKRRRRGGTNDGVAGNGRHLRKR